MSKDVIYFNFPIQLLDGFLESDEKARKCLKDVIDFTVIHHATTSTSDGSHTDKIKIASNKFCVQLGSVTESIKNYKRIVESIPKPFVMTAIKKATYWDFYENKKTEFEKAVLLAHLSLKSVLIKHKYAKYNNLFFWSRMDGKAQAVKGKCELSFELQNWCTEYKTGKIIKELKRNWHLQYYAKHVKGFYVSHTLSYGQLVEIAETRKIKYLDSKVKDRENKIENEVKQRMYSKPQNQHQSKETPQIQDPHFNPNGAHYSTLLQMQKEIIFLSNEMKAKRDDDELIVKYQALITKRNRLFQLNQEPDY